MPPFDKRGKTTSHSLTPETHHTVNEHIKSFPLNESHLSGEKMNYQRVEFTVKGMWKLFKEVNPELKVSSTTYWRIFRGNFNYSFWRLKIYVCCLYELRVKMKSPHLNEVAKRTAVAELIVRINYPRALHRTTFVLRPPVGGGGETKTRFFPDFVCF